LNLKRYQNAKTKVDKTFIVVGIVNSIRRASPCGGFIKKDTTSGRWVSISDEGAREKVGYCLRDMIVSSTKRDDQSNQGKPLAKNDTTQASVAQAPVATKLHHSKINDPRPMPQNRGISSKHISTSGAPASAQAARTTPYVPTPTASLDNSINLDKQHPGKTSVAYPPHPHVSVVPQISPTFHNFEYTAVTKGNNPEMSMQQNNILRILEGGWKGSIDELLKLAG
jgi:hypothetical protein